MNPVASGVAPQTDSSPLAVIRTQLWEEHAEWMNETRAETKIKTGKEKLVSDVATTLQYGCRLISDWLYIPIRFQHSEEDHTHNAQQEREEGSSVSLITVVIHTNSIISSTPHARGRPAPPLHWSTRPSRPPGPSETALHPLTQLRLPAERAWPPPVSGCVWRTS